MARNTVSRVFQTIQRDMQPPQTFRQPSVVLALVVVVAAAIFSCDVSFAANPPAVDSLVAKGVQIKTENDGTVSELSAGPKATITAADYQIIGSLRTLKRANISP